MEKEKTLKPLRKTDDIYISYNISPRFDIHDSDASKILIVGFVLPVFLLIFLITRPFNLGSFILIFFIIALIYSSIDAMNSSRKRRDYLKERELILEALEPIVLDHIKVYGDDVTIEDKGYYTERKMFRPPKYFPIQREFKSTKRTAYFELSNFRFLYYYTYEVPDIFLGNKPGQRRLRIAVEESTGYQLKKYVREAESKWKTKYEKERDATNEKFSEFKSEFHQPLILLNELIYNHTEELDKATKTEIESILRELNEMCEER